MTCKSNFRFKSK